MARASAQQIIDGGSTVNVPATQSSPWNVGSDLIVGDIGSGTLNISSGGQVTSGNSFIANGTSSTATVFVTGAGATWDTADTAVGYRGNGTLTIINGGAVTSTGAGIGIQTGSTGIANVGGTGASWTVAGNLIVGAFGNGTLNIGSGGQVKSVQSFVGNDVGGTGNVFVDGTGSVWQADILAIGYGDNSTGKLGITNNAAVNSLQGLVGGGAGSVGSVEIDGSGSAWTITNDLTLGYFGTGTIKITNGGQLNSGISAIGGVGSGSVIVDGAGSTWTATSISIAGAANGTGHLTITNGGVVTSNISDMATQAGSVAVADVSGAGSTWNTGGIAIGGDGDATLHVSNGGKLTSDNPLVGLGTGSTKITITGPGSSWVSTSDFISGQGQITVSAGATMSTAGTSVIGVIAGRESQILITGAGSSWTTGGDIYLGGLGGNSVNNGSGSLIVTNAGTVDVNGGAGTVFVGTGNGLGSRLVVDGTLNGQVSVSSDGRLGGIGTIGNTTVYGTIAPGNSIGTLNVAGNLTMQAGSIYEVEANAAGQSDKIVATGTANLIGGTVKVLAAQGNYAPSTKYTIINAAGGVSGVFDSVTSNLAFLNPTLTYDPNNVYLTLVRNLTSFASIGVTPNQISTGAGLESTGGGIVYNAVLNLAEPDARGAFDQLSGEIHASAKSILIDDSRFPREAAINRLRAAFGSVGASSSPVMAYAADGPVSVAADTDRFAIWGQGFGGWGQWKGDGNAAQLNRSTGGFIIGADGNVQDSWRIGGFAGYSTTSFDVKERRSSGGSDNYHAGLYAGTEWNAFKFRSGVAYTWHDLTTSRSIAFTGFSDAAKAKYNAGTAQAFGEFGYGFNAGPVALESFANLAYVNLRTDSFTETGGAAALTSPSSVIDTAFTTLGLRASNTVMFGTMATTMKGSLGWRHAFGDIVPVSTFAFAGGNAFNIAGVPIARDAAVIDAGLDFHLSSSAVLGLSYGGQFGSQVTDQTVRANFSAKF